MGIVLTATAGLCLWVILWAGGIKGFDGFMITIVMVLVAATVHSLLGFLPTRDASD
jgi:hypothetical protein